MLYERELPGISLSELESSFKDDTQSWSGEIASLSMNVTGDNPVIHLPARGEIPFPHYAQQQFASRLKVPRSFYDRIPVELRQQTLETLVNRTGDEVHIDFKNSGVESISDPKKAIIKPSDIIDVALEHFPGESTVVDVLHDADVFQLDVLYGDENNDLHIGGDLEVGDITRGGVRFGYNFKSQAKPWLSPYLYRLMCTNGMETPEMSLKLTAEGNTAQEYLLALSNFTESALGMVRARIDAYYALRSSEIDAEPSLALSRMASAHGLPDSTVRRLVNHLGVSPANTMFDLVNIITNEANNPQIEEKPAQRRKLQRAGGNVVVHQNGFCDNCGSCM